MATDIKKLEDLPNVGPIRARKLRDAGYFSVESIAVASSRELSETSGLRADAARALSQLARKMLHMDFQTADELLEQRKDIARLTTGVKSLDDLLGGGVETRAVLELIGQYGAGKTQICLSLCVTVQLPTDQGGLCGNVLFIDTEGTFRPERLVQISQAMEVDTRLILKNVIVARAFNSDHQILIVQKVDDLIRKRNIKLIIVDSIISHFRAEYVGRETLPIRQQRLNKHLHRLLRLAEVYNMIVVITNQVVSSPDVFYGPSSKPAGGNILAHLSTNRVFLRRSKKNMRIAKIIDSPYLPESECVFLISDIGIKDTA